MDVRMEANELSLPLNWDSDRLSHAYIADGRFADMIAMAAVCGATGGERPCKGCAHCDKALRHIHPDIIFVEKQPDRRDITVDKIRELKRDVIVLPSEAEKKAYIVNDADLMNTSAQNALLQILEEPPAHVVFILNTTNPSALLPTVRSRCVELGARPDPDAREASAAQLAKEFIESPFQGNLAVAGFMFKLEKLGKDAFGEFLIAAREQVALRLKENAAEDMGPARKLIAQMEPMIAAAMDMHDLNVNAGHISGMLCATLIN